MYFFFSYTSDAAISRRPIRNKCEAEITETAIDYMYNVAYVGGETLHDTATLVASRIIHVSQVCTNINTALYKILLSYEDTNKMWMSTSCHNIYS